MGYSLIQCKSLSTHIPVYRYLNLAHLLGVIPKHCSLFCLLLLLFFFYLDASVFLGLRLSPSRSEDFPAITEVNTGQRNSTRSPYNMKIVEQSAENEVLLLRICKQSGQFVLAAQMSVTRLTEAFHAITNR